jgi:BirA family transcriptional regulator, biotin operon repressor / biotin---[acetyl-CoA-carboxylase] ligase
MNIPPYVDLKAINSLLTTNRLGKVGVEWPNEVWDAIGSTNDRAAELAAKGAPEGVLVFARQQTAGRGRLGRSWVSPADVGVHMSCVMRPDLPEHQLPTYTLVVGVACARAVLSLTGVQIGLKWVNDLVYGGRKLGGILCEKATDALVVGIGLNVHSMEESLPGELANKVEWLDRIAGNTVNLNMLVAGLVGELESVSNAIEADQMLDLLDEWRNYSITLDKNITAVVGNETIEGRAEDIDDEGALLVTTRSGETVRLQAGEISIRGSDGSYY